MKTVRSKDGTTIAYDQTGHGPPLVLVDGALNSRAFGLNGPLAAVLADRFTVVTYDRRGRGDSGDTPPYAVQREIEDLAAVTGAAGGPAYLYGISACEQPSLQSVCAPASRLMPRHVDRSALSPHPAGQWARQRCFARCRRHSGLAGSAGLLPVFFLAAPRPAVPVCCPRAAAPAAGAERPGRAVSGQ